MDYEFRIVVEKVSIAKQEVVKREIVQIYPDVNNPLIRQPERKPQLLPLTVQFSHFD